MGYDIIVVGTGPGGYVAAIRASQLGMKVAVVEKESLGGICLNWGCIPTKALLKSAQVFEYIKEADQYGIKVTGAKSDFKGVISRSRDVANGMSKGVTFLMRKNNIDVINGHARLARGKKVSVEHEGKTTEYEAAHIILATGGRAKELPNIPIDGERIIEYRKAMSLAKMPKSMVVVGAGAIGVEFAYFYSTMGTKVTIIEFMDQGLLPREDKDISRELGKIYKKSGMDIYANTAVEEVKVTKTGVTVKAKNRKSGEEISVKCDVVLSAAGVTPNTEDIGLELLGVEKDDHGMVKVDEFYNTNVPGIYAIGDIVAGPALAHVASAEGITCVEKIAGKNPPAIDYNNIPGCTYCSPEVASVGYTEVGAKEAGYDVKVGKFPFSASGKAKASGHSSGFVKVIFDSKYGEFLGAHLIGSNVTEIIAEVVVARNLETTGHEIIKSIHPHPTMSEALMEAAAAAYDEVIHL